MTVIRLFFMAMGFLACCALVYLNLPYTLSPYQDQRPELDLESYFQGQVQVQGVVRDFRGRVQSRFEAVIQCSPWTELGSTWEESFLFDDGTTLHRQWQVTSLGPKKYRISAPDVPLPGYGSVLGPAGLFLYTLRNPVGETFRDIACEDSMHLMADGHTILGHIQMKKWGLPVGSLQLVIQNQEAPEDL